MISTAHSEYQTLLEVYLKPAEAAFVDQGFISSQWKGLNYLGQPDFQNSLDEYSGFQTYLKSIGAEIRHFPKAHGVSMDSIYCRDSSIITDFGVIICNMGKDGRVSEAEAVKAHYQGQGLTIFGHILSPGTVEGGDVAWLDQETLAIGLGYRTNPEGISQMRELLEPRGVEVVQVDLPHYKGPSDVFHLMSILSPVDHDLAVVYSPLMSVAFRENLIDRGIQLVEVPDEEFDSMGCNVLAVAPRKCMMVAGNTITANRLRDAGCEVFEYEGQDISVKGGGGPTCLTRPMRRGVTI